MGKKSPASGTDGKDKPGQSHGSSSSQSPEVPKKREKLQKQGSVSNGEKSSKEVKVKTKSDSSARDKPTTSKSIVVEENVANVRKKEEDSEDDEVIIRRRHAEHVQPRVIQNAPNRTTVELSRPRNVAYVVSPFNICVTQYAATTIEIPADRLSAVELIDADVKKNKPSPSRVETGRQRSSRKNNDDRNGSSRDDDSRTDEKRKRESTSPVPKQRCTAGPSFEEVNERIEELRKHRSRRRSTSPASLCSSEDSVDLDLLRMMNLDAFKACMMDPNAHPNLLLKRRFLKPSPSRAVLRGPRKLEGNENSVRKAACRGAVPEDVRRLLLRETSELMNSCLSSKEMDILKTINRINERPDIKTDLFSKCLIEYNGLENLVDPQDPTNLFVHLPEVPFFRKFDIELMIPDVVPFIPCKYNFDLEMFVQLCDHLLNDNLNNAFKPLPKFKDRMLDFPERIHSIIVNFGKLEEANPSCIDVNTTIGTMKGLLTPKRADDLNNIGETLNTGITLETISEQLHDLRQIIVSYSNVIEDYILKRTSGIEQTAWRFFKKEYEVVSYHTYNSVAQTYIKMAMAARLKWPTLNLLRSRFTLLYHGWNCYIRQLQIAETARRELSKKSIDPVIWEAAAFIKKRYDQALPSLKYMFSMERFDRVLFTLGYCMTPAELRLIIEDSCDENATRIYDLQNGTQTYRSTSECAICRLSFTSPHIYKLHMNLHSTSATCRVCFKNCYKMSLLFIHVLEKHPRKLIDFIDHAVADAPRQFTDR
ncbi:unnamed protein product [Auanema sp. JU1783]|nr:unnamed protein product [Auanema sp. JU1783]